MPNGFRPRGSPTAEPNSAHDYDGWNLLHRGTMAPWGIYEKDGQTSDGFAWPAMVTEPLEAGKRFFTPGGGFENNPNSESEKDALTILMSLYGGNALSGATKGAAARAAESAPLTAEALFSDTGKPSPMGSALASQWSPEAMAERMRAKMGPQPAPPADPALQELIDLASELPRPPKAEMQPTARGVSSGALGLKPAVSINGNVYSGPNHALAAMDSGLSIEDASTLLSNGELRDGYVTRDGQFLTRKEAEKLIYKNSSSKSSFGLTTKQLQTMEGGRNDSADDILRLYGM